MRNVVALFGGLGNQLFQVAFGLWLERHTDWETWYDASYVAHRLDVLDLGDLGNELREHLLIRTNLMTAAENDPSTTAARDPDWLPNRLVCDMRVGDRSASRGQYVPDCSRPAYWIGHWGREAYARILLPKLVDSIKSIRRSAKGPFIGVHVRRGDMLKTWQAVPSDWFEPAVRTLRESLDPSASSLPVWVWSDDLDWCRENLDFVAPDAFALPGTVIEHLAQLSDASALVISRSSFSWWAAVLSSARRCSPVIYPAPWPLASRVQPTPASSPPWIPLEAGAIGRCA